jgi:hypothetical protein
LAIAAGAGLAHGAMLFAPAEDAFDLLATKIANPIVMGILFLGAVTTLGWFLRKRGDAYRV